MSDLDRVIDALAEAVAQRLQPTEADSLPLFWSIKETQERTGLGRDTVYELVKSGQFRAIKEHPESKRSKLLVDPESVLKWKRDQLDIQAPQPRLGFGQKRPTHSRERAGKF
jgi:hypothetical protein